jgi:hypothetical protein
VLVGFGIFGIVLSSILISNINRDNDINGLGDAISTSCSELEFLNDFFNENVSTEGCENDGGESERERNSEKLPLLGGIRIASGILIGLGILGMLVPINIKVVETKARATNSGETIEEKLKSLDDLKDRGVISSTEHKSLRKKLLEEI